MAQTPQEYYSDEANYGGYQYVTLEEIINELLSETTDPDSHLSNTKRSKIVRIAKNCIRSLNREVKKTVFAIERSLTESLNFPLPQDYVDWEAIYVIGKDLKLYPLNINDKINTSVSYLQDSTGNLIFDSTGQIIATNAFNALSEGYKAYIIDRSCCCENGYIDTSKMSLYGEAKIDNYREIVVFSSNLVGRAIVFQYISDGLQNEALHEKAIKINKVLKDVLLANIYYLIIDGRRHVPYNEKRRALDRFKALRHRALIDTANFNKNEIIRLA